MSFFLSLCLLFVLSVLVSWCMSVGLSLCCAVIPFCVSLCHYFFICWFHSLCVHFFVCLVDSLCLSIIVYICMPDFLPQSYDSRWPWPAVALSRLPLILIVFWLCSVRSFVLLCCFLFCTNMYFPFFLPFTYPSSPCLLLPRYTTQWTNHKLKQETQITRER